MGNELFPAHRAVKCGAGPVPCEEARALSMN